MRLGVVPDDLLERMALLSGMLPPGIFECWFGIMLARTVMATTRLNVFESLAAGPLTAEEVAERCGTHPRATEKLLNALVGVGCLQVFGKRYRLRRSARSWVLKDGKHSFPTRTCCTISSGTGGSIARNTSGRASRSARIRR